MKSKTLFSKDYIRHIAKLASLSVTDIEEKKLADGFNKVLGVVDRLNDIKIQNIEPAPQITGLVNVFREDKVDEKRMLSQEEALQNAKTKYNGYFMIDQILEE